MEILETITNHQMIMRVALIVLVGFPLLGFLTRRLSSYVSNKFSKQNGLLVGKVVWYAGIVAIFVILLQTLGFSLTPLLGAAGILGIAIGFASQTSVSNIISGLFLVTEKPFGIGDVIVLDSFTGEVLSIDTLSVKLRTFDNRYVRIPNEAVIKAQVTNMTHFPIRRLDLAVGVAYKEDLERVRDVLLEIVRSEPLALQEPEPLVMFQAFGDSAIEMTLAVWGERLNFLALRNALIIKIKRRFDDEGIEIPFPHLSLYAGSDSEPMPLRVEHAEQAKEKLAS